MIPTVWRQRFWRCWTPNSKHQATQGLTRQGAPHPATALLPHWHIRESAAMTAGGQNPIARATSLPPVAFVINIAITAVCVSGSDPPGVLARRDFIASPLPHIRIPVPAMIAGDPYMPSAWAGGPMLTDADRGPKPDYDLRMGRHDHEGKSEQRGKNYFSHFLLL